MAAMAYSMLPQEVIISTTYDTLDGTNNIYYIPLSVLENIAEVMGDGWDTDEITSTSGITYQFRQGGYTRNLAIDKNLPILKHIRYPSLYFSFICESNASSAINVSIINASTGSIINWCNITNVNMAITHFDVYSFNNKTKALSGASSRDQAMSAVVFAENAVVMPNQVTGTAGAEYLGFSFPNGTYQTTRYYNIFTSQAFTTFEKLICNGDTSAVFDGLYVEMRGTDLINKYVTVNGITYKIFGQPSQSWQGTHRPKVCVSSELIP